MSEGKVVTVVDYGMGNIHSLVSALRYLSAEVEVTREPSKVSRASTLILPGVGSFPSAIRQIKDHGLDLAIQKALGRVSTKLLGICLGMQLLGLSSSEGGGEEGLGIFDFDVQEFSPAVHPFVPLPHIGFNSVNHNRQSPLFVGLGDNADYYFAHEFRVTIRASDANASFCMYGEQFVAAIDNGKVFGTQFHPEKSQTNGLRVLENFLRLRL